MRESKTFKMSLGRCLDLYSVSSYFISRKQTLISPRVGGQIKGLDVTFQMHRIPKIFDIIKYLKNEKNQKLKKKEKIGKMAQKGPKWQNSANFFSRD